MDPQTERCDEAGVFPFVDDDQYAFLRYAGIVCDDGGEPCNLQNVEDAVETGWSGFEVYPVFSGDKSDCDFSFSPYEGTRIYGTRSDLFHLFGNYWVTKEQLFYELNVMMKYVTIVPAVFMFVVTTNPSEFAASLNRIGISYNIGYSVAIALRYIPDVQDDFSKIRNAQEARGIEMSGKASFLSRIKNTAAIIFPLIFTSMDRIDVVSNAMELRGFGKHKKRTWYMGKKLERADYITLVVTVLLSALFLFITFQDGSRFYNPFTVT